MPTDLEKLADLCALCTDCGLAERRINTVFGSGDPQTRLVLVGEGPGDEEDKTGIPFVGKAGKMLNQAILDAGLSREEVYVCNTLKCRAADWGTGRPVNRPPARSEVAACRRWLVPQLALIQPRVILCIGAASARNLIKKKFKMTAERGLIFPCDYATSAIAALHPAYISRKAYGGSDGGYSLLVNDIKLAWTKAHEHPNHTAGLH